MARTETIPTSIGREDARRRIARWRETHPHRNAPMPAALWAAAVAVAQQGGLYRTARRMRVDYGTLKKRLEAAGGAAPMAPSPAFVEFAAARPGLGGGLMEVTGRDGRRLRGEVSPLPVSDLVALAQGV